MLPPIQLPAGRASSRRASPATEKLRPLASSVAASAGASRPLNIGDLPVRLLVVTKLRNLAAEGLPMPLEVAVQLAYLGLAHARIVERLELGTQAGDQQLQAERMHIDLDAP